METSHAYNEWSVKYDEVENKTRDLEAVAFRAVLNNIPFKEVLELGCGTGKNTVWLADKATHIIATDFSEQMLNKAKEKTTTELVVFKVADITNDWTFIDKSVDLITCSLILEHIENLDAVFAKANTALKQPGYFYIGELHPFKQYQGSKARFETGEGTFVLKCFTHHVSDYFAAAKNNSFNCVDLNEWVDDGGKTTIPRILSMLFKKK